MENVLNNEAKEAAYFIEQYFKTEIPQTVLILGSGLSTFTDLVNVKETIKYADIPHFPQSYVKGHKGNLSIAEVGNNKSVLVMEGRFHYYEGYTPQQITLPIAVFNHLGIRKLIISNAAGGINTNFKVGDLMIITDHINMFGNHPLIGCNNDTIGPRFLDQTEPYSAKLIDIALATAFKQKIKLQQGTYLGVSGPTYETKAEIKAFGRLGADAVGMSTIFEVIMANYFKINVLGISCITNMATGLTKFKHKHADIVETGKIISGQFSRLVKDIILEIPND
ncbi:MAG: purine-nucleoside phosphorylase [Neisseriaceae bacterium]